MACILASSPLARASDALIVDGRAEIEEVPASFGGQLGLVVPNGKHVIAVVLPPRAMQGIWRRCPAACIVMEARHDAIVIGMPEQPDERLDGHRDSSAVAAAQLVIGE